MSARTARRRWRPRAVAVLGAALAAVAGLPLTGSPPADAAGGVQVIPFEAPINQHLVLGDLASRTQANPLTISGIGPYTMRGTDARTGLPYEFVTDTNYSGRDAYGMEGAEKGLTSSFESSVSTTATFDGRTGVLQMTSATDCEGQSGTAPYCSVFGPYAYSAPFAASPGMAVSFDWAASQMGDHYEAYAFLVAVTETEPGVFDYGTDTGAALGAGAVAESADHTVLAYGRGSSKGWSTTSAPITTEGSYRFLFVNGSFDGTGGLYVGATMYVDAAVKLGLENQITFPAISDKLLDADPFTISATASSQGAVTFTSATPSICTVATAGEPAVTTVTLTGSLGVCRIVADEVGGGDYVPAQSTARSFTVRAAATAPVNAGLPYFVGTPADGESISIDEGFWSDGGAPITGTAIAWQQLDGEEWVDVSGETGSSCELVAVEGARLRVVVTKTNEVGSTSAISAELVGYECGSTTPPSGPAAPPSQGPVVVPVPPQPPTGPGGSEPLPVPVPGTDIEVRFHNPRPEGGSPALLVTPVTERAGEEQDRGVTAVTSRYDLAVRDLDFDSVDVCIPFDEGAFDAQERVIDRLRLLHLHDGVETDITTFIDRDSDPAMVCGNAAHFSEFQVAVYAGDRVHGEDRYATAAALALRLYPAGAATVFVATGENHPDALAAGVLASYEDAPVLLVRRATLPAATVSALLELEPMTIVVVGGPAAVADEVVTELGAVTGAEVRRLSGDTRYDTAAAAAAATFPDGVDTVYLATGAMFPDALTGGAVAVQDGAALLLTAPAELSAVTAESLVALDPSTVVVVGGPNAVADTVVDEVRALLPAAEVSRVFGADRYATAAALAAGRQGGTVVGATGRSFADALVGTTLATAEEAPILLVDLDRVPEVTRARMGTIAPDHLVVVGGHAAFGPRAELVMTRLLPLSTPAHL
jgi:putative cell wall-binding protein